VTESATTTRATERRQATAARLTALCRRLTAERGLHGFTIEEVCSEVGVSRRTFFNYFPSKEDAVFGVDEADELRRFIDDFLARGSHGWGAVVDDLIELVGHYAEFAGLTAADHLEFMTVLGREPKLLARFIGLSRERDQQLLGLVAQREGVSIDHPLAQASVTLITAVLRSVGDRLTDPRVAENFGPTLHETLAAMREVLAPSARKAQP